MSSKIVLKIEDLVSVAQLCGDGTIPVKNATAVRYCSGNFRPQLPAVKVAGSWKTTRECVHNWIMLRANAAMRRKAV